jgi:hypothetical protein
MDATLIVDHLHDAHGIDTEVERWPDGEPVIVDMTLDPRDFDVL